MTGETQLLENLTKNLLPLEDWQDILELIATRNYFI